MKRLIIITLAMVCLGVNQGTYAEIINGYDSQLKAAHQKISNLNEIAHAPLNKDQHKSLKKWMKDTQAIAKQLEENHAKTQELIERFKMIDPGLFDEINTIKDCDGHETNVYIQVVDALQSRIVGTTNLNHHVGNPNVYTSDFGEYTVSVRVVDQSPIETLRILVHELGHVRYQVPHLAEYTAFYKRIYQNQYFKGLAVGHLPHDPSHQSVLETLKSFEESCRVYHRERKETAKDKTRKMLASHWED